MVPPMLGPLRSREVHIADCELLKRKAAANAYLDALASWRNTQSQCSPEGSTRAFVDDAAYACAL